MQTFNFSETKGEEKMKKSEMISFIVGCLNIIFLMVACVCSAADYELLNSGFSISTNPRHQGQQWVVYNPINNDFLFTFKNNGVKRGNCEDPDDYECTNCFLSIENIRVSADGKVLGETNISPPEGPQENVSWKDMSRIDHNPFRNEYLMVYLQASYLCVKCHSGTPQKGNVQPNSCATCHPFASDPGTCNLIDWHAHVQDANCQSCHKECSGGSPPAIPPTQSHIDQCLTCHKDVKHSWLHGYPTGNEVYVCRIDSDGKRISEPKKLHPSRATAAHLAIRFNPDKKQYLVVYDDRGVFSRWQDNVAFILDEDGNTIKGPFTIQTGDGNHFVYDIQYNAIDKTFLIDWEDFRHANPPYYYWPNDIYGAIVDPDGNIKKDYAVIADFGLQDTGDQWYPAEAYNPDKNEYLVMWVDKKAAHEATSALMGRIIKADGTYSGDPFVIIDGHKTESQQQLVYIPKEKKYFIVWNDSRNFVIDPNKPWLAENDIYGQWLDDNGQPIGEDIPIYVGPGDQTIPRLNYNPVMDRLLVSWWDTYAPQDYQPLPCENIMWAGPIGEGGSIAMPMMGLWLGDVRGTLYGKPSFLTVRVVEEGSENPVEGATVMVLGLGLFKRETTNIGGWSNLPKDGQGDGKYFVIAWYKGAMAMEPVLYKGEPLHTTIAIKVR
jgi:hypothetical protein